VMRANKARFRGAQYQLAHVGIVGAQVVNPCDVCAELEDDMFDADPDSLWRACMRLCLRALTRADAIVMLPGHESSAGAAEELRTARLLGLRVYSLGELLGARAA
jgi:hypothetical protein